MRLLWSNGVVDSTKKAPLRSNALMLECQEVKSVCIGAAVNDSAMSLGAEKFSKRARLAKRSEFLNLAQGGKKVHTSHFIVITKTNDKGENRLGVTVSTRVGKAVVRNRIKRLLREFFRRHRLELPSHDDIVIIARKGAGELSLDEVAGELRSALTDRVGHQR